MAARGDQNNRFSGVLQIVVYNWHFYAATLVLDLATGYLVGRLSSHKPFVDALLAVAGVSTYWAIASLLASHVIYDRSELYQWAWLAEMLKVRPTRWANIHAGLDQSSEPLMLLFPGSHARTLDIYLPSQMSEPSIKRARRYGKADVVTERADPSQLPLDDAECDAIFLIFVAHELRKPEARVQLFREASRSLPIGGRLVLTEHLRDWKNFAVYGPGAFHFFSEREWLNVSHQAGFELETRRNITPFVRCFVFVKPVDD